MASNTLALEDRIRINKPIELKIIRELNKQLPIKSKNWRAASANDDMHNRIDAWLVDEFNEEYSVQIKYRETGGDLGIAVLRPWEGNEKFLSDYAASTLPYDRDMKTTPGFYVAGISKEHLLIVDGNTVHRACELMIESLACAGGFSSYGTSYSDPGRSGAELRLVRDKGNGYSLDHWKVICYMEPWLLRECGGTILKVDL